METMTAEEGTTGGTTLEGDIEVVDAEGEAEGAMDEQIDSADVESLGESDTGPGEETATEPATGTVDGGTAVEEVTDTAGEPEVVEASEPVDEPEPAGDAEPTAEVVDDVPESVEEGEDTVGVAVAPEAGVTAGIVEVAETTAVADVNTGGTIVAAGATEEAESQEATGETIGETIAQDARAGGALAENGRGTGVP